MVIKTYDNIYKEHSGKYCGAGLAYSSHFTLSDPPIITLAWIQSKLETYFFRCE